MLLITSWQVFLHLMLEKTPWVTYVQDSDMVKHGALGAHLLKHCLCDAPLMFDASSSRHDYRPLALHPSAYLSRMWMTHSRVIPGLFRTAG